MVTIRSGSWGVGGGGNGRGGNQITTVVEESLMAAHKITTMRDFTKSNQIKIYLLSDNGGDKISLNKK